MKLTKPKLVFIIALSIFLITACQANNNKNEKKEDITIGFIGPLSGNTAVAGEEEGLATELAINEINQSGGVGGRKIKVVYENGKCTNKDANAAANKLINIDGIKIILGGICSAETLGAAPVAEKNNIILFSAFSSSPEITNAGDYIFRNILYDTDKSLIGSLIPHLNKLKSLAIITANSDYTLGIRDGLKDQLAGQVQIVADEVYNENEVNFKSHLTKIADKQPEALFVNSHNPSSPFLIIRQTKELGFDVPLFGNFTIGNGDYIEDEWRLVEGAIFFDVPLLEINNPRVEEFKEKFTQIKSSPYSWWEVGARYDSVYIIKNALEVCGENTECIKTFLYNMGWYDGVIGRYKFDQNGDVIGLKCVAKIIRDGKIKVLE